MNKNIDSELLFCRNNDEIKYVKLNGELVYKCEVFGESGVVVDRKGNVYIGNRHSSEIND